MNASEQLSVEEMLRNILQSAIDDKIVVLTDDVRSDNVSDLSNGDILIPAGLLARYLRAEYFRGKEAGLTEARGDTDDDKPVVPLVHLEEGGEGSTIDLDSPPFNPWEKEGVVIEEHQKGGQWKFDPEQVNVDFLVQGQQNGRPGHEVRKELQDEPVFNANLLDYLLTRPEIIPDDWKKYENGDTRYIFFWGTEYRDRVGDLFVRCLYWRGGRCGWGGRWHAARWRWRDRCLGFVWQGNDPAAVRKLNSEL